MSDAHAVETEAGKPLSPMREIIQPFIDLIHAPRSLWGINLSYFVEGLVYFGWLSLLPLFFNKNVGLNDLHADWMVSFLTAGITLSMFFFGGRVDRIGVRKGLIAAVSIMLAGRVLMVAGTVFLPVLGGVGSSLFWCSLFGLLGVIVGYGLYQPAAYAGVREYCDERTAAMGFAMLYALMNAGGALPGFISPPIRHAFGIPGVFWTYVGLTALGLIVLALLLTKKVEAAALATVAAYRKVHEKERAEAEQKQLDAVNADRLAATKMPPLQRSWHWIRNHPLADPKFAFFIFALIPVQTLFAHNWLTLPQYVSRCMGTVGDRYMEFFVNFINPVLIFILTPMVAALTKKRKVYNMMIAGTFVMAVPTFLLAIPAGPGTRIWLLLGYLVIMSFGEAMWQPRFLQYAAEIAPKGRTGAYMGVAQFPWFLTKVVTGLYAGWFLMRYVPETGKGAQNPELMWLIYACIAMISTVLLILAKRWVGKDFKTQAH